jgi:hypothetical protein
VEPTALPKVTPYLLRRADALCERRLAEEVEGGTRSDDPVNRARMREAFLAAVRNVHAEMRAPALGDFSGIGRGLEREEQAVLEQAARWYVQLFGARPAIGYDHGLDHPTESPRRGVRIGGWVDLTVVDADGAKELRQFDLWCGPVPLQVMDLESARLAVLRLTRWIGDDELRVVWTDLVRGIQREAIVTAADIDEQRAWFDERVALVRRRAAHREAVNGADCGQCNVIAGCPEHGDWHGRARGRRDDFRGPILRLNPTALAAWNRCPREWRNGLLVIPPSDAPGPTHFGDAIHALLKLVHEEGSCRDDALVTDVLARHGADNEQVRATLARHAEQCPGDADAVGHEIARARFQFRPGPPFMASARIDALWKHDGVLDARDYKTGHAWDHRLSDDAQARVQAWVLAPLAHALGLRLRISFEYLSGDVTVAPEPFEPEPDDLDGIGDELRAIVGAMRAESEFAGVADPHVCGYCRFRSICPDSAARSEPVWPVVETDDEAAVADA